MIGTTTLLAVSTLGRFEARRDTTPLAGGNWSRRKVVDLFKLLLSAEQHRLHREQVQEILWPTSTLEQATNSFGKTLYLLRRVLEPDLATGKGNVSSYVLLEHDTLLLVPDHVTIDADVFEASVKPLQARMRSRSPRTLDSMSDASLLDDFDVVLALYRGDYLPEDLYEDYVQRRRDRLRRIHSWLLENAAELALAITQGLRACEYLQALLESNSADEQTHRQLMQVYARMGHRSDALNQYQLLREVLKEELHTQPLPETITLYRAIQSGQIATDLVLAQYHLEQQVNPPVAKIPLPTATPSNIAEAKESLPGDVAMQNAAERAAQQEEPEQLHPERILNAALVGREAEIQTMQRTFQQAYSGVRKAIFLCGEPGIGKTRLAREFAQWVQETQGARVLWGYCYEMSGTFPYQPIMDAINEHVRLCSAEQLRSMLGDSAVYLAKIAPEVRSKLPDLPQPEPIGPELERLNLYNAVAHFFSALAAERPPVIILDDLQWADPATIQLLHFLLAQNTGTTPLDTHIATRKRGAAPLYLLLYRADEVHETHPLRGLMLTLSRNGISEDTRLQRLTESQVQQLLGNMARQSVGPNFTSEIFRQTEGNPFFIGEAVRSLILEGKIKRINERWQTTVDLHQLELPHSVRLLIERRLLHLSPECRTTLTLAAVLGRKFSSALLCAARNLSEESVAEHIDDAIRLQILSEVSSVTSIGTPSSDAAQELNPYERDLDLAFTHDKIREVLYHWLNPLRRRTLHQQVARAIETHYAAQLQPFFSTLAYHYQMAEKPENAVNYLLKAAWHASSVYAFANAAEYIKTALDLLVSDEERPQRAALLRQLSEIFLYTGHPDKAIEAAMASAALWRALHDEVKQAEAYLFVAFCCHWQGRELEAVEHIQLALKCIELRPEETFLLAKANAQWGLAATVMGNPPLAHEKLTLSHKLHASLGGNDAFISVVSLWSLSWCAFLTESPHQMLAYAQQGAEVCSAQHKPEWEPMMDYSAAYALMLLGRLDDGRQLASDTLLKAQRHGVVGAQGWANLVQAFLAIQAGQWEEAALSADRAYTIATMLHDADLQARVHWSRSVCAGWRNDWHGAIDEIQQALRMAKQDGETSMVFPYLLVQAAKSYLFADNIAQAQHYLTEAMQLGQSRHYRQLPAIGNRLQGRIWQAQHRFAEAQPCFEHSLTALLALDDKVEYARTQEAYGAFYLNRHQEGDEQRGQALLQQARAIFQQLGVNG
ncbi:MAG TPA: AAA family ATPase [Ktedonobacteraceae bacterium]|nr:AAA family ATPase [Ktedonobacteraceae bacterium]